MKKFEPAEFEIIRFNTADDIVLTSGGLSNGGPDGEGDGGEFGELFPT